MAAPALQQDFQAASDAGWAGVEDFIAAGSPPGTNVWRAYAFGFRHQLQYVDPAVRGLANWGAASLLTEQGIAALGCWLDDRVFGVLDPAVILPPDAPAAAAAQARFMFDTILGYTTNHVWRIVSTSPALSSFMIMRASEAALTRLSGDKLILGDDGRTLFKDYIHPLVAKERIRRNEKARADFMESGLARHMGASNGARAGPASIVGGFLTPSINPLDRVVVHTPGLATQQYQRIQPEAAANVIAAAALAFAGGRLQEGQRMLRRVEGDLRETARANESDEYERSKRART